MDPILQENSLGKNSYTTQTTLSTQGMLLTFYVNIALLVFFIFVFEYNKSYKQIFLKRCIKRFQDAGRVPPVPPNYIFGWLVMIYKYSELDILHMVGLDAYMMLRYITVCLKLSVFVTFWGLVVLTPVYSTAAVTSDWDHYTIFNVLQGGYGMRSRQWVATVFGYVFAWYFCNLLYDEYNNFAVRRLQYLVQSNPEKAKICDPDTPPQKYFTCMIEKIPAHLRSSEALFQFFNRLFPGDVYTVEVALDLSELNSLCSQRKDVVSSLEKAIAYYEAKNERPKVYIQTGNITIFPDDTEGIAGEKDTWVSFLQKLIAPQAYGFEPIDAIGYYTKRLEELNLKVKELQDSTFLSTINVDAKLQDKLKKRYDTRAAQAFESIGNLGASLLSKVKSIEKPNLSLEKVFFDTHGKEKDKPEFHGDFSQFHSISNLDSKTVEKTENEESGENEDISIDDSATVVAPFHQNEVHNDSTSSHNNSSSVVYLETISQKLKGYRDEDYYHLPSAPTQSKTKESTDNDSHHAHVTSHPPNKVELEKPKTKRQEHEIKNPLDVLDTYALDPPHQDSSPSSATDIRTKVPMFDGSNSPTTTPTSTTTTSTTLSPKNSEDFSSPFAATRANLPSISSENIEFMNEMAKQGVEKAKLAGKEGLLSTLMAGSGALRGVMEVERVFEMLTMGAYYKYSSTAFVTFNSRVTESIAQQMLLSHDALDIKHAPNPHDIIWENVAIPRSQVLLRTRITNILLIVGSIFWSSLVTLVNQFSANVSMSTSVQNYISAVIMLVFLLILPFIFDILSRNYEGLKTETEIQNSIMTRYFYYQLVNVYVTVGFAGWDIWTQILTILRQPHVLVQIMGESVPKVSLFFANLIILKTFIAVPIEMLRPWQLSTILAMSYGMDRRQATKRELRTGAFYPWPMLYGWVYPQLIMVLIIMITYSCIAPLLLPFCLLFFVFAYIMYKYQLLFVYINDHQSGGYMWYALFDRSLISLLFASLTLLGFLSLQLKVTYYAGPFYAMLPLPLFILYFWHSCDQKFRKQSLNLSLGFAKELDEINNRRKSEGLSTAHDSFKKTQYRQPSLTEGAQYPEPYREYALADILNSKGAAGGVPTNWRDYRRGSLSLDVHELTDDRELDAEVLKAYFEDTVVPLAREAGPVASAKNETTSYNALHQPNHEDDIELASISRERR